MLHSNAPKLVFGGGQHILSAKVRGRKRCHCFFFPSSALFVDITGCLRQTCHHVQCLFVCNIHGIWVAIHGIWVAKFTTLESCWQQQDLAQVGGRHSTWQELDLAQVGGRHVTWLMLVAGTVLGSSWWQARDLAHVGGRHSTWLKLVAGTVLGRNMTWLKLVAGTVLARNVTWLMLVAGTVLGRNMTWLMLVAGHCYLAATGLGSSWWQAQYLAGT